MSIYAAVHHKNFAFAALLPLKDKYELDSTLHAAKLQVSYHYNIIYILKSSMDKLQKVVKPFIHPTMLYKLNVLKFG